MASPSAGWSDSGEPDPIGLGVIAVLGAALSLLVTGFVFGTNNNLFHLPIIGQLYDEPQFQTDAYMQSLRFFAAGPFVVLRGADRYVDPAKLFLVLDYLSRLLAFVGFLACGRLLGVVTRRDRAVFVVLLAFTSFLIGDSFAGAGGLFIDYFTHSEVANGLSLLALYYMARGRVATGFALNGATFFMNAFVAVWNAVPIGCILLLLLVRRRISPTQALARACLGLVLFLVLASPVIANVLANPHYGRPIDFDYLDFLVQREPFHFLFGWNPLKGKIGLLAVCLTGLVSLAVMARRDARSTALGSTIPGGGAEAMLVALIGFIGVYGLGIVVPFVTHSPAILNLHLLRSGGSIHLLAALAGASLATVWLSSAEPARSRVFGPILVLILCSQRSALMLAPLVILMCVWLASPPASASAATLAGPRRRLPVWLLRGWPRDGLTLPRVAVALILLVVWPGVVVKNLRADAGTRAHVARWASAGAWARENTPADAVFLLPTSNLRDDWFKTYDAATPPGAWLGSEIFDYASHRRVWTDFKRGAAVMWSPSYYPIWHERIGEVLALGSLDQKLDYAAAHGIGYVADRCVDGHTPLYHSSEICVYQSTNAAGTGG